MFRSCITQASRYLASSSRAELHTTAICRAKPQAPKKTVSKLQAKVDRKHAKDAGRLYVVLGSEYNKEDKWIECDLQKTILTSDAVYSQDAEPHVLHLSEGEVNIPSHLSFGIEGGEEKKMLFEVLPTLTVERGVTTFDEDTVERTKAAMKEEVQKANIFARLVDLKNANAKGLAYENRRRIIAAFSTPEQPNDTGRPEVQAALLTYQIRNLWTHLLKFRKDVANRRALRQLVHDRAKVLRYLKHLDRDRYEAILPRLGLDKGSVEGELII
ncbi:S15/NS1 RNA-binding domain-containing protein [Lanmaoa asiatica]|nr:S15/NS1 RNA-binding domain-containing protein [Lanmaoa asiatica]